MKMPRRQVEPDKLPACAPSELGGEEDGGQHGSDEGKTADDEDDEQKSVHGGLQRYRVGVDCGAV